MVCIKRLAAAPDLSDRLRELGFCEEQKIRLLSRDSNLICQVCNARLGISEELAESILVEPLSSSAIPVYAGGLATIDAGRARSKGHGG